MSPVSSSEGKLEVGCLSWRSGRKGPDITNSSRVMGGVLPQAIGIGVLTQEQWLTSFVGQFQVFTETSYQGLV